MKREMYYGRKYKTKDELIKAIEKYIDYYTNRRVQRTYRLHTVYSVSVVHPHGNKIDSYDHLKKYTHKLVTRKLLSCEYIKSNSLLSQVKESIYTSASRQSSSFILLVL